jgi:hypothetical protein
MNSLTTGTEWLLRSAAGGGLVLLVAWMLASRIRQPALRQRLGEWGLASALLLAVLSLAPAWLLITVPVDPAANPAPAETPAPAKSSPREAVVTPYPAAGLSSPALPAAGTFEESDRDAAKLFPFEAPPEFARAEEPRIDLALPTDEERTSVDSIAKQSSAEETTPAVPAAFLRDWRLWIGLTYTTGACLFLVHWMLGHFALWRILRRAVPASPAVHALFDQAAGGAAHATLLVSDRLRVPISCGLWRPTVVVPQSLCTPATRRQLRWVFAHELTHLARRDAWACLLFNAGRIVYFYLPWFWWLRRQARLCQEFIADQAAVPTVEAADYAQFLVGLTRTSALPAGATGVTGSSSDLFRRITMLLQPHHSMNRRAAWLGSLAAALCIVALAVIGSGVGLRADAVVTAPPEVDKKDPAKKDEPKKDDPKKDADKEKPAAPDNVDQLRGEIERLQKQQIDEMRKLMEKLRGADQNDLDQIRKEMEKFQRERGGDLQKKMQQLQDALHGRVPVAVPGVDFAPVNPFRGADGFPGRNPQVGRLGAHVEKPDATLVEQLDLPKGQGLVVGQVKADSPAAKAGLKPHDILLEINGKAVPDNVAELAKALTDIKADHKVDAVVLRKGKKETLKDLSLPEPRAADKNGNNFDPFGGFNPPDIRIDFPNPFPPNFAPPGGAFPPNVNGRPPAGANGVMTSAFITGERFTTRHQEGSLIITVSGTMTEGKAKTTEIQVQDGNKTEKYESVDKVPEAYRDKVKNLVDMSEKSKVKIDVKTP